ncbi:MAG TPA: VCBS repeat-containing protein [Aurantimonas sp.]|uniref:VCBS repeat-containing protein n=1 Tax=Aurantimonas marianensis TaxID=2920428 RepID=A0A9X2KFV9_9HYPH|nr:VCBS repeat-containing protein [Aurantimonas marianensis]MCP3056214.1 VCBS repeat-containing protein [Aurantimonas marianensis]
MRKAFPATRPRGRILLAASLSSAVLFAATLSPLPAAERLPDGDIAVSAAGDIAAAWFARPTTRYAHEILGDAIEAGSLVAETRDGRTIEAVLPETQVFEDLTPRLVDMDGDGRNEIIAIRSDVMKGAALAVYGLIDGQLVERAAIPPIGRPNRWLNVAAIADLDGNGRRDIAIVKTPHIGGTLEIYAWEDGKLLLRASRAGYSNHVIGSRELDLAEVVSLEGTPVLILPNTARTALEVVRVEPDTITPVASIALAARAVGYLRSSADGKAIEIRLEDGSTVRTKLTQSEN